MLKKPLNKRRLPFLEGAFPENLLPFKKLNKRAFRVFKDANRRVFTNRIKRVENRIVKRENVSHPLKENIGKDVFTLDQKNMKGFFIKDESQHGEDARLGLTRRKSLRERRPEKTCFKYVFSLKQLLASFNTKQSSYKRGSVFKNLLKERKKLSIIYGGLGEKQIQRLAHRAKEFDGEFDENFVKIVERRLDVALFRICFFPTILSAKQWISHKHILVNNSVVTLPGFQLSSGDVITVAPEKKSVLKKKISFFVAEKVRIRSRHYHSSLRIFYKLVKNSFSSRFDNKNPYQKTLYKILYSGGFSKNNLFSTFSKTLRDRSVKSFLKLRNLFTTARSLTQRVRGLRISAMKPLNLEVCYKNMVAVFLYSPQKVAVPTSVNLHAIQP